MSVAAWIATARFGRGPSQRRAGGGVVLMFGGAVAGAGLISI